MGVVSCCGTGLDNYWAGLNTPVVEGERRVVDFEPADWYENPKLARRADRCQQFAEAAARMAVDDVGGAITADPARSGVIFGTGVGGMISYEANVIAHHEKGARRVSPFMVPMMMPNASGAAISMQYGLQGPNETITTACSAGTHSIANGARLIASDRCDVVVAGGTEAAMSDVGLAGFSNMTALSTSGRSMPFDARRDGFMMTEGAAVLVLEELEHARARGAHIRAEVLGSGSNADAHHITAPSPGGSGAVACMQLALDDSGMQPQDIVHINAHGTATPLNDAAEAEAISKLFGSPGPIVTSTKGVTGHGLGAAGALEAVALVLSIEHRLVPPTAGFEEPDPELPELDLVVGEARPWEPGPSLSNSFGFGGHNGTLVLAPAS